MNNEVKNVPSLRFPGFIGEWKTVKLGDIANKGQYGLNAAATEFDGVNKYIRITDIDESTNQFSQDNLTSPSGSFSDKYLLQQGDILFARTGASVGKSYIYNEKDGKVYFAGFLMRFKITNANAKFIFYNTLRHSYGKWVKTMSARSGQPGINAEEYESLKLNLPSKQEQEKIAEFLTAVDERIELASCKVKELETYKRGLTQKIFTRTLRFKRDDGSDFPDWVDERMRYVVKKNSLRNRDGLIKHVESVSNKHGFVRQEDYFSDRSVASQDTSNYFVIKQGMFAYNPSRINVGSLAYKFDSQTSIVSPLYVSFSAEKNKLTDLFLLNWFFTEDFIRQRDRSFEGSVRDTLSFESLGRMRIMLPCLEEQQKIATFLSQIDEKITLETQKLEELKKFKKALLQRMFV